MKALAVPARATAATIERRVMLLLLGVEKYLINKVAVCFMTKKRAWWWIDGVVAKRVCVHLLLFGSCLDEYVRIRVHRLKSFLQNLAKILNKPSCRLCKRYMSRECISG